jgi:hypothetical protein
VSMRVTLLLMLAALALSPFAPAAATGDTPLPVLGQAPGFALTAEDGKPVSLAALRGKIVAVTFIFTGCSIERAAVREVSGDPGGAERVAADFRCNTGRRGPLPDHPPGVRLPHGFLRQHSAVMATAGAEQPALAIFGDAGRVDIGAQRLGQCVMARHAVLLAAFLMQPNRPSGAARPEVFDLHLQGRVDTREAIGKSGDQRAVAQVAQRHVGDRFEKLPPFGTLKHRRLPRLDHMLWSAHGHGRSGRQHLAGKLGGRANS